jgi:type IV pilus assembly protein PilE
MRTSTAISYRYRQQIGARVVKSSASGFTLIEVMITVAIVAILAAIAYPNYSNYIRRSHRADATAALLRLAAAQEKFYVQNNTYATSATAAGIANTEHGWYTLAVSGASTTGYTATATAPSGSNQYSDTDCREFSITHTGQRGAANSSAVVTTATCWR